MIVTPRIAVRIGLLLVASVVIQLAFLSHLPVLGATPDLLVVVVVTLGLLGGGVLGAVCGFAAGLVLDSALLQTLGVSSLALLTAGYLGGRYREGFDLTGPLVPIALAGGLTVLAASVLAVIHLMLGVDAPVSLLVVREIVVKGLLSMVMALPVYVAVRRLLRPALIEETLPRRPGFLAPTRTA